MSLGTEDSFVPRSPNSYSVRDMKQNHAAPEEANVISFEYSSKIDNLSFTIMQLRQFAAKLSLDAVMDVDSFMKDITKK